MGLSSASSAGIPRSEWVGGVDGWVGLHSGRATQESWKSGWVSGSVLEASSAGIQETWMGGWVGGWVGGYVGSRRNAGILEKWAPVWMGREKGSKIHVMYFGKQNYQENFLYL